MFHIRFINLFMFLLCKRQDYKNYMPVNRPINLFGHVFISMVITLVIFGNCLVIILKVIHKQLG